MKMVYEAANSVDAHMMLNLLEAEGFEGRVDGEFLQGGAGGLPAFGMVSVSVLDHHYDKARKFVVNWEQAQQQQQQ